MSGSYAIGCGEIAHGSVIVFVRLFVFILFLVLILSVVLLIRGHLIKVVSIVVAAAPNTNELNITVAKGITTFVLAVVSAGKASVGG